METNLIGTNASATTNVLSSLSYRGSGAISTVNYGNGRKLEMGYSANRQQPVSMKVSMASNANDKIMDYAYEYYDANGKNNNRIRKITDNLDSGYTTTYTYDDYDRLTYASATAYTRSYFYDEWGNIKNFNGLTLSHATNASGAPATNRLSTDGFGFAYTYDSAGNQTNAPGYTYTYDGANRLKTVNGSGASYGYDGDGRKVRQTTGSNAIFYVYSTMLGGVAMEVNSSHGVYRAYVYVGNKLIAQQSYNGQFYWMHQDHLGSGRKMTDASGVVQYRGEFDPYGGMLLSWSGTGYDNLNSKRFTGYERDTASGLDYANARMYNSSGSGRFTQPDPKGLIREKMKIPQSLNRYAYAGNDPVNHVDPDGKDWDSFLRFFAESECAAAGGDFGGFFFNQFGQLSISCRGRGIQVQQLTKQLLESLGEWQRKIIGRKVPLFGQKLVEFNEARSKAVKLLGDPSSDCAKFLNSRGFSPVEFATALSAMVPYDALLSTNEDSFGVLVGRVNKLFNEIATSSGSMPDAAVNNSGTSAYFTSSGLTVTIQIHETYHMIRPADSGVSDADFYRQLGGSSEDYSRYGSRAINTLLEKEGCK